MKKLILIMIGLSILLSSGIAFASDSTYDLTNGTFNVRDVLQLPTVGDDNKQPTAYFDDAQYSPLVSFILMILNYATAIIGSLSIIMFIIIGFMFLLSQGDQQRIDNAKEFVKFAIIGLVATFLSYLVIVFVQSIFITSGN